MTDTGELYLVRLGPTDRGGGKVEVLAVVGERERLEDVLEGWREQCGRPRSLSWLRERASRFGERVRAAQRKAAVAATGSAALAALSMLALESG